MGNAINVVLQKRNAWLIAGLLATIVLTIFMEGIARLVLGGPMKPAALICALLGVDDSYLWLGEILHYLTGLIAFPIGFVVLCTLFNLRPALGMGFVWGIILWIAAGAILVPLSGGPLMYGMGKTMVASFVAHTAYGMVLGYIYQRFETQ